MTRNYRNTREIAAFAASLVGESGFVDIESGTRARMDGAEVLRDGVAPVVERFSSAALHDAALLSRVQELLATPGVHPGDIGVLAQRTRDVAACVRADRRRGTGRGTCVVGGGGLPAGSRSGP